MTDALLMLEDGNVFEGESFGSERETFGEVVFNTSMTGYQEVLTDPSYNGQIVAMTYPHIGNYGVNDEDPESAKPRVAGFVVRDLPETYSSWRANKSLREYLADNDVVGITEIDTRRLTRLIRDTGAMRGAITSRQNADAVLERIRQSPNMLGADLTGNVTARQAYDWDPETSTYRVAALDYGIKFNILRELNRRGCSVKVYPSTTPADVLLADGPDGVFISNGPGDPEAVIHASAQIAALFGRVPVFGICLGHQLMAIAAGLETFKLPFGHRGCNHPVSRLSDGAVEITTQNHGFAVSPEPFGFVPPSAPGEALPRGLTAPTRFGDVEITHLNLNDYTIEGLRFADHLSSCVQYHPEAGPGPHDSGYLFDSFVSMMQTASS